MDCVQAQQVLSEALDREPATAELLAEARAHCRECPECGRFVRGLSLLQRVEPAEVTADLHDRVMAAIAAERSAAAAEPVAESAIASVSADDALADSNEPETAAPSEAPSPTAPTGMPTGEPVIVTRAAPPRWRREPWRLVAWAGAAAVVLVAVGIAALIGVRGTAPTATSSRDASVARKGDTADENLSSPGAGRAETGGWGAQGPATATAPSTAPNVVPSFITVNDVVYREIDVPDADTSELTVAGATTSALDTEGVPQNHTVFATPTPGHVAIVIEGEVRTFIIVTRTFGGRTYMLTSDAIEQFGVWPALPSSFTVPTTDDGAPTFTADGEDDLGVQLYSRPGIPVENGVAVAPGTTPTDPAQGNPNWTWWATPAE